MHIIYVCADSGVPLFGTKGASLHVQEVVRVMSRRHRVTIIAARVGGEAPADLEGVEVLTLPSASGRDAAEREHAARLAAAAVPELIAAAEQMHGPAAVVYERYSLWSTGGMRAAAARGIPGVLEVNAPLIDEQARHRHLGDRGTADEVARTAFAAATAVVAVSEAVAEWVRDRSPDPRNVHVVPNGVDPTRFRRRAGASPGAFTVGFVGSLKAWHGVDLLIDAMRGVEGDAQLLIVGDGPQRSHLERAARSLGPRIVFTGAVLPAAIPTALARMDVAVAPYPADATYFSPLKVFEYMAAGTAVVASAVGQVPELIEHGRTGLLVAPGDVAALTGAIVRLRDEPLLRRALGAEARRIASTQHTWQQVVDRILELSDAAGPRVVSLHDQVGVS